MQFAPSLEWLLSDVFAMKGMEKYVIVSNHITIEMSV